MKALGCFTRHKLSLWLWGLQLCSTGVGCGLRMSVPWLGLQSEASVSRACISPTAGLAAIITPDGCHTVSFLISSVQKWLGEVMDSWHNHDFISALESNHLLGGWKGKSWGWTGAGGPWPLHRGVLGRGLGGHQPPSPDPQESQASGGHTSTEQFRSSHSRPPLPAPPPRNVDSCHGFTVAS